METSSQGQTTNRRAKPGASLESGEAPGGGLAVRDVSLSFSGVAALDDVSLDVPRNTIKGLIGPNGAGKTTLVNVITGYAPPDEGHVFLDGVEITDWTPDAIGRAGLGRTFQSVRIFAGLSARENIEVAAVARGSSRKQARAEASELLKRFELTSHSETPASALPFGLERRLSLARVVASKPQFLLLDEPAAGLNEAEKVEFGTLLTEIQQETGCGVLIIEHDMHMIHSLCGSVQVLAEGRTLAVGTPAEIAADKGVVEAFLGKEAADEWVAS